APVLPDVHIPAPPRLQRLNEPPPPPVPLAGMRDRPSVLAGTGVVDASTGQVVPPQPGETGTVRPADAPPDWAPPPAHMVEPMTPEEIAANRRIAAAEAIPAAGRAVAGVAAPPPLPKLFGGGYLYPRTLDEA